MTEPNPTGTLSLANRDHALGEMIRAISAAQLPVPAMPKLRRAKGGEYSRQEFLREAEIAIALSQRPAATYMPGPLLAAIAEAGDTSWLRRARASAAEVGAVDGDSLRRPECFGSHLWLIVECWRVRAGASMPDPAVPSVMGVSRAAGLRRRRS